MMRRILLAVIMIGALSLPVAPAAASTAQPAQQFAVCASGLSNLFGIQPWYACLPGASSGEPQLTSLSDIFLVIFPLVDALIKIAVYVTIGYIFWMLFKLVMARGDSGKIAQASLGIRDAIIGLVIALISIAIVNFISSAVQGG